MDYCGIAVFQGKINGIIKFIPEGKHVRVVGAIQGLQPGKHGLHVHQYGDLSDGCMSACAHWDPYRSNQHGFPKNNSQNRHMGDLGNLNANSHGIAKINYVDKLLKIKGKYSIIGRSLIIHEDEDDGGLGGFNDSHTTGHAGKRIACVIIGYSQL
jgi:Cu-Zn family superoxide dismutase